jgi:hypothetical protein
MLLDTRTIVAIVTVLLLALAAALTFYRAHQRTYPGFTLWVLGTWLMGIGYVALALRGPIPEVVSVFTVNCAFVAAAVARLDGATRFTDGRALGRWTYAVPPVVAAICLLPGIYESVAVRSLVTAAALGTLAALISAHFLWRAPESRRLPYLVVGLLHGLVALVIVVRGGVWMLMPTVGMLDEHPLHSTFFVIVAVCEVFWAVAFTMMNANRLEAELRDSQDRLTATVGQLETALADVRTLSGLLPVCCSCQRIRDDEGYWKQLHEYLEIHQGVKFSHGICPECQSKLYPEFMDDGGVRSRK